jgi:hypothetical protein
MLEVVAVLAELLELLVLVVQEVAVLAVKETQLPLWLEVRILEVVAVAVAALVVELPQQAVQASSSSNTPHLLNPYSHSKVLASGLHLLA